MPNNGYLRASQDQLITLPKHLEEEPWKQIDTTPYQDAKDQLNTPLLPLLKLRILRAAEALVKVVLTPSDALTLLDARWDSSQRRLVRRIEDAEESDDPKAREAGTRLRALFLLGNGLAQTQLSLEGEYGHGGKQVALARAKKLPGQVVSAAEDVATLGLEANIREIEQRTFELGEGLRQVSPESPKTSRYAQLRHATSAMVNTLNAAHDELVTQREEANSDETKSELTKLLGVLQALIPDSSLSKKEPKEEAPKQP
jgi:hypothetical protein